MVNMKRIGKSKVPLAHQLPAIAENLRKKFNKSCLIKTEVWSHTGKKPVEPAVYTISFVPGFNEECTQKHFKTWADLLGYYFKMMRS